MARRALGYLAEFVRDATPGAALPGEVRALCSELGSARPSMAAIGNLLEWWAVSFSWPKEAATFRREALAHTEHMLDRVDRARRETVRRAIEVLPGDASVLTHSASGTVREVLSLLPTAQVMVTASEPGGEGRRFAREIGARCIDDPEVPRQVGAVDLVLVGADAVLSSGDFINKIGTRAIAAAARQCGVPFYVVFESFKRLSGDEVPLDEPAFERTAAAAVTQHITDTLFQCAPS